MQQGTCVNTLANIHTTTFMRIMSSEIIPYLYLVEIFKLLKLIPFANVNKYWFK
jgi:hypothetical protein